MADANLIDVTEFTCPRCGSHKFGTSLNGDPRDPHIGVGYCHNPCGFSWRRSDDAKYFRKTGRQIAAVCIGTVER